VKPFFKAYYNAAASMADRQTYTFVEHFIVSFRQACANQRQ